MEKSPWWGGFYQRVIGIANLCFKKVIGKALLIFEDLRTIITEIENALNSRPLTYIDENPDSNIITPNHLIY